MLREFIDRTDQTSVLSLVSLGKEVPERFLPFDPEVDITARDWKLVNDIARLSNDEILAADDIFNQVTTAEFYFGLLDRNKLYKRPVDADQIEKSRVALLRRRVNLGPEDLRWPNYISRVAILCVFDPKLADLVLPPLSPDEWRGVSSSFVRIRNDGIHRSTLFLDDFVDFALNCKLLFADRDYESVFDDTTFHAFVSRYYDYKSLGDVLKTAEILGQIKLLFLPKKAADFLFMEKSLDWERIRESLADLKAQIKVDRAGYCDLDELNKITRTMFYLTVLGMKEVSFENFALDWRKGQEKRISNLSEFVLPLRSRLLENAQALDI